MSDAREIAGSPGFWLRHMAPPDVMDAINEALRSAYRAGQEAAFKRAAEVVTEHYQGLSTEHRLLLVNRATAIRSLQPEDMA